MRHPEPSSRRFFLASVGTLSAAGLLARGAGTTAADAQAAASRGLAPAEDYLFSSGLVYVQTGSLGPTPRPVMDRVIAAWKELEQNPTLVGYGVHEKAMDAVRARAAAFLGCRTEELVLTRSTTDGMNWVAQGLGLTAGDHVLTTDQEHPGGRSCWDYVARKHGVVLDVVPIPPGENDAGAIIERCAKAITPRTRAFSFSHVLSSTGLRMPATELCALGRRHGVIAVVDGAQATGGIPVDVKALGCHAYATSGHKWLLGPKGTGLLYLSEELGTRIDPIALQGGRAAYSESSGVTNIPGVLGLDEAIAYVSAIGPTRIEAHNLALRNHLYELLRSVRQVQVVSGGPGPLASPLLTYRLPDHVDSGALQVRLLEKHGVMVKVVPKQWLNGQRISTHLFNTESDVEKVVTALKAELA